MPPRLLLFVALALPIAAQTDFSRYINSSYSHLIKCARSAEQGDPIAQYNFALICERGEGIPRNHPEAVKWLRLSAYHDYAPAQLFLGCMYSSGKGVKRDLKEARKWLKRAADQGDEIAKTLVEGFDPTSKAGCYDDVQSGLVPTTGEEGSPLR